MYINVLIINVALVILAALLVIKELASASRSEFGQSMARVLNVPIIPLLIFFILIVGLSIIEMLI